VNFAVYGGGDYMTEISCVARGSLAEGAGVVVGTTTDMGTNIITKVIPTNTEKNLQQAV
jgi:hypothetical protein